MKKTTCSVFLIMCIATLNNVYPMQKVSLLKEQHELAQWKLTTEIWKNNTFHAATPGERFAMHAVFTTLRNNYDYLKKNPDTNIQKQLDNAWQIIKVDNGAWLHYEIISDCVALYDKIKPMLEPIAYQELSNHWQTAHQMTHIVCSILGKPPLLKGLILNSIQKGK